MIEVRSFFPLFPLEVLAVCFFNPDEGLYYDVYGAERSYTKQNGAQSKTEQNVAERSRTKQHGAKLDLRPINFIYYNLPELSYLALVISKAVSIGVYLLHSWLLSWLGSFDDTFFDRRSLEQGRKECNIIYII